MDEISSAALNAVYRKGYAKGRSDMWDECKGGKRWWVFYPYAVMFGLFVGMMVGALTMSFLLMGVKP